MRLYTKIRFAMDMIIETPLNFMLSVFLCGVSLALFGFTFLVYLAGNNSMSSAEKVLSQGVEHTGIVQVENFSLDTGTEFRKQAFDSDIIHSIGAFHYAKLRSGSFPELYQIQCDNAENQLNRNSENCLQVLIVDQELLPLCQLRFQENNLPEQFSDYDEDVQYLYLGNAYNGIPVGTEFCDNTQGVTNRYIVAGILEKDIGFVSQDLLFGADFTTLRSDVNLNYEIICVNKKASVFAPWMFSVNKSYTLEEGMVELERLARRMGVKIREYNLNSVFDRAKIETGVMQESLREMLFLLLIVTSIIVTSLQIVEIFQHFRSYGIMYAVGVSSSEIFVIMILRNMIYFVFSICVGLGLLFAMGNKFFITNEQMKRFFFELLFQQVLPWSILLMTVLFGIMTWIPCFVLSKQDPVELIQR